LNDEIDEARASASTHIILRPLRDEYSASFLAWGISRDVIKPKRIGGGYVVIGNSIYGYCDKLVARIYQLDKSAGISKRLANRLIIPSECRRVYRAQGLIKKSIGICHYESTHNVIITLSPDPRAPPPLFFVLITTDPVAGTTPTKLISAPLVEAFKLATVHSIADVVKTLLLVIVNACDDPDAVVRPVTVYVANLSLSVGVVDEPLDVAGVIDTLPAVGVIAIPPEPPWIVVLDVVLVDPKKHVLAPAPAPTLTVLAVESPPIKISPVPARIEISLLAAVMLRVPEPA
jgi:hypothetical protein